MKKILKYIYKHFATLLTLLVTVITSIILNCIPDISVGFFENFVMASIIGLNLTFLFDFTKSIDLIDNKIEDLKTSFPSSRIQTFESVDQVAENLRFLLNTGKHTIDIIIFDTKIRTSNPKKVNKMHDFLRYCSSSNKIKLRLAFVPAEDSICERIENIIESEKKNSNSYFAYQESKLTFASFMIIDDTYVSIRTPHKNGSKSLYCIVNEQNLYIIFSSWFNILWDESNHIDKDNLDDFISKYNSIIPREKLNKYKKEVGRI